MQARWPRSWIRANNFAFDVHQYLDADSSGKEGTCVVGAGASPGWNPSSNGQRLRRGGEGFSVSSRSGELGALSDTEAAQGLQTAVSGPDEISSVTLIGGTALIDFAKKAEQTLTADPLATAAQLTCTLTAQPGVGLVRFSVNGTAIEIPTSDGALTDSPVSATTTPTCMRKYPADAGWDAFCDGTPSAR